MRGSTQILPITAGPRMFRAMRKQRSQRSDFDSPRKEALEYFLIAFLAFFFRRVHAAIDWSKGHESLDKKLHQQMVKCLYDRGWSAEDVRQLFRVIDWLLDLPEELQKGFEEDLFSWEEEKRMPYITSVERSGIKKGEKHCLQQFACFWLLFR